jgi:hypothetical protein
MSFNFDKALADSSSNKGDHLLGAIVLGPSGAGKSSVMGTMPGKILYLHTTGESHGPKSARATGKANVMAVCIDRDGDSVLSPDASYDRLLAILSDIEGIKKLGIGSIALDGASELESIVRATDKWAKMCTTAQGKHNGFAEPTATITMLRPVISALKTLQQRLAVHYAVSCILDVKTLGADGAIEEATPRLQGFSVAESLVQQFGDVLVVGRMERDGVVKHKLQFMSDVTKVAKDERGTVKKAINFAPRLAGVLVSDLAGLMDADLAKLVDFKKDKLK